MKNRKNLKTVEAAVASSKKQTCVYVIGVKPSLGIYMDISETNNEKLKRRIKWQIPGMRITGANDPYQKAIELCDQKLGIKIKKEDLRPLSSRSHSDKNDQTYQQECFIFMILISEDVNLSEKVKLVDFEKTMLQAKLDKIPMTPISKEILSGFTPQQLKLKVQ
jgi:hypothetical protein